MTREEKKNEFLDIVKESILEFIPNSENMQAEIVPITKVNDVVKTGLVIKGDTNMTPTIYLDKAMEAYADGADLTELLSTIARQYNECEHKDMDVSKLLNFDQMKDFITTQLVNTAFNNKLLSDYPHKEVGDMSVILKIQANEMLQYEGNATIKVTEDILDKWGVTFDEALSYAAINDVKMRQPILRPVEYMLLNGFHAKYIDTGSFLPEEKAMELPMYVLTTNDKTDGANTMLHPELLDETAKFLASDLVIITSSVHEVIVIPYEPDINLKDISAMICEVNAKQVAPEEILNDHPYVYDKNSRELYYEKEGKRQIVDISVFSAEKNQDRQEKKETGISEKLKAGEKRVKTENMGKTDKEVKQTMSR